jgi:hypothetical protein
MGFHVELTKPAFLLLQFYNQITKFILAHELSVLVLCIDGHNTKSKTSQMFIATNLKFVTGYYCHCCCHHYRCFLFWMNLLIKYRFCVH